MDAGLRLVFAKGGAKVADAVRQYVTAAVRYTPRDTGNAIFNYHLLIGRGRKVVYKDYRNSQPGRFARGTGDSKEPQVLSRFEVTLKAMERRIAEGKDASVTFGNRTPYFIYFEYGSPTTRASAPIRRANAELGSILGSVARG